MKGLQEGWDGALSAWAHAQDDVDALVQIGSRVQAGATVDRWSDYDYQLITSKPEKYRDGSFAPQLGPCWAHGAHTAFGNSTKVTAVYEGALEADFVILRSLDVRIATAALGWPGTQSLWPRILKAGIANLRIVVGPGWRMVKGGPAWEKRYAKISPHRAPFTESDYRALCGEFWTQLVWAEKKRGRGEFRASQRALHVHLLECCLRMLQEEALQAGRPALPLGRRAEQWMSAAQLGATEIASRPDSGSLATALGRAAETFQAASASVAASKGWSPVDSEDVLGWLSALHRQ